MRNFAFIKHRQKISGYPIESVSMFWIKGGMKKGGWLLSQNKTFITVESRELYYNTKVILYIVIIRKVL